jgi:hypothetical protein
MQGGLRAAAGAEAKTCEIETPQSDVSENTGGPKACRAPASVAAGRGLSIRGFLYETAT